MILQKNIQISSPFFYHIKRVHACSHVIIHMHQITPFLHNQSEFNHTNLVDIKPTPM
jgi:hypothetical protein